MRCEDRERGLFPSRRRAFKPCVAELLYLSCPVMAGAVHGGQVPTSYRAVADHVAWSRRCLGP